MGGELLPSKVPVIVDKGPAFNYLIVGLYQARINGETSMFQQLYVLQFMSNTGLDPPCPSQCLNKGLRRGHLGTYVTYLVRFISSVSEDSLISPDQWLVGSDPCLIRLHLHLACFF